MKLIASQLNHLLDDARTFLDQLNFASKEEYLRAASAAIRDLRAASISSWTLAYISFRPIFILLGIIGHYLAIVLRIIAKHSVVHGWIAAKEGYFQFRMATIWFIKFQSDLPTSLKYAELGALAAISLLWLLRRHVKKKRYIERIEAWSSRKKRLLLRKYLNFVERLAKTSSLLALLLPHFIYAALVIGLKRAVPSAVTYVATRTYLCSIISFWHPLYLTCSVLGRLSHQLMDYEAAASSDGSNMTVSKLKRNRQREIEVEILRMEVIDLLKYWVVYAILLAFLSTGRLIPFVGRIFNMTTSDVSLPNSAKGLFGRTPILSLPNINFRLPHVFVMEVTLAFFVWLRLMPSSITGDEVKDKVTTALAPKKNVGLSASRSKDSGKNRPLDILYGKLSPVVLSAMSSTAFLTKRALGESRSEGSTAVSVVIQKLQSFLDLFVMVRLMSKDTKEWIVNTSAEGSALLPAVPTLLMPSYFTSYGVIYVGLIVPAGNSISCCNAILSPAQNIEAMIPRIEAARGYLQFWVIHAAVSTLLASFAPILAWIPLSTHATWLLWAYVQLQSSTSKIIRWFESELGKESLGETTVGKSMRQIIAVLPSDVSDPDSNQVKNDALVAASEKRKHE